MKRMSRGVFDTETLLSIGERIRHARGKLTQEEFAKRIGVGRTVLANYEAGRRLPNDMTLEKIAQEARTTVHFILMGKNADRDPFDIQRKWGPSQLKEGFAVALFLYDLLRDKFSSYTGVQKLLLWGSFLPNIAEHFDDVIGENVAANDSTYEIETEAVIEELKESEPIDILELIIKINADNR